MFKFGHIDMETKENPILWDKISKDDFDLIMKCKNLYEQCIAYTGRNIHDVYGCAGNLLNGLTTSCFHSQKTLLARSVTLVI